jgi:hypothetical protein
MNFTPSITEPPPTARIKSIFCSLITATAFINVSKCDLVQFCKLYDFVSFRLLITCSWIPFLKILPPPYAKGFLLLWY